MNLALTKTQVGSIFAVTAAFLFSTKAIFIKQAYELSPLVDGTVLMALRMLSALPFFLLLAWLNRAHNKNIAAKDWGILVVAGLIGYYLSSWLDFAGLMYISASLERIILFLYPTLTVIATSFIYKKPLNAYSIFAIALSYGGTVIVMLQEQSNVPHEGNFWLGVSLVFASAISFAAYLLLTPRLIHKFGSWNFSGLALSIACIGMLTHYCIATPNPIGLLAALPSSVIWYGIALGLLVTVLPTILVAQSIARLGAAQTAMIASIGPILTIILATLLLGETLNTIQWFGCALNIIGVLMITLAKKKLS
ncbi:MULTISPECIES: DMT family transporter [Acinetobacter]|uniref:DMT family transporter n=1 Tax=Acinetobacter faecalis TaxID=2665161 RepID=A0AB35UX45_9GAMM|nr:MULTISPECIES: DMT family transporter [Acinetobacter]MBP7782888.1 DMT family transporter [Acinetobacter sp.]MBP7793590.1 DMT family transporter [Acinetobacter sp.]MDY6459084.1 DMT family transporter [Acinetobacter faecalis]MDY6461491.1 DMT family transporter [Acinetobacter faecalis]MDY6485720.1 DMT family transporter [Acinetobacter faecalis]